MKRVVYVVGTVFGERGERERGKLQTEEEEKSK